MACSDLINWTAWLSCDVCVNWNEPQVSCLQLYEQPGALNNTLVWAGGCKRSLPRYPKSQSRTCYQECGCHLIINCHNYDVINNQTSQLAGKPYEVSDYTIVIAVVHWLKRTYNNCAETHLDGGVLSAFVFPLIDRSFRATQLITACWQVGVHSILWIWSS